MGMDSSLKHPIWVIAGAESSGKTTLFESLKKEIPHFHFVPEFNRQWLEKRNLKAPFSQETLSALFKDCLDYYQNIHLEQPTLLDTDLLNLFLWAKHTQHPMTTALEEQWKKDNFSYLLCPPHIPFEKDSLRSGESVRQWAWEEHLNELKKRHCIVLKHNDASERLKQAVDVILSKE